MAAATATVEAPKKERLVDKRTTFLLLPNSEHEDRIGRHYIDQLYGELPETGARIVQAIPAQRLTDEHCIVVIARKRIRECFRRQPDATGMPQEYPVAIEELVLDVKEREPIAIKDYWLDDLETGGKLDMPRFMTALNKAAQPFCVRYRATEGKLRLFYL